MADEAAEIDVDVAHNRGARRTTSKEQNSGRLGGRSKELGRRGTRGFAPIGPPRTPCLSSRKNASAKEQMQEGLAWRVRLRSLAR